MCLIFIAKHQHEDYPLLIAANRDEFYNRPTLPLHAWENSPIIAGKDLSAGGTWLGVTAKGRFAALTNYRDPADQLKDPLSRGLLVKAFLESDQHPQHYLTNLANQAQRYQGFNLLVGEGSDLWYFSNRQDSPPEAVSAGIHGLSNHLLNTPWPKVKQGKQAFKHALKPAHSANELAAELIPVLNQREPAPDSDLPNTGVGLAFERALSPRFIHAPGMQYGTRCTTILIMDNNRQIYLLEQNWNSDGEPGERIELTI